MIQALALADDLTGALEVGAILTDCGVPSIVTLDLDHQPFDGVVVIDTETRHAPPEHAREVHRRIAARWPGPIFKKTDSTLRGNIGAEFHGLIEATGRAMVFAPAYPRVGRTVSDGVLLVDGVPIAETAFARDPRNPVLESNVARVIANQCPHPVEVQDAATDTELAAIAATLGPEQLVASPAGFTGHWASRLGLSGPRRAKLPSANSLLIVCGSLHPRSREQAAYAAANGYEVFTTGDWREGDEASAAGELAERVIYRLPVEALVIFGGDTAHAILRKLSAADIVPLGEVMPGVPASRVGRQLLITKAGGFGPVDLADRIRATLKKTS